MGRLETLKERCEVQSVDPNAMTEKEWYAMMGIFFDFSIVDVLYSVSVFFIHR